MRVSQNYESSKLEPWDGNVADLPCIGNGVSGLIFAIDQCRVAKISLGTTQSIGDIETERRIYRRFQHKERKLGKFPHVLRCLESNNPRGLVFERCEDTVRERLQSSSPIGQYQKLKWAIQAAKGLRDAHDCRVIQGDVGCHNMLIDTKGAVRIGDFAGSSIDCSRATINYEVRSRLPGIDNPTTISDIFALGSALYEIATGHPPYQDQTYRAVQARYKKRIFPADVDDLTDFGPIIKNCWEQKFDSCLEVLDALRAVVAQTSSSTRRAQRYATPVSLISSVAGSGSEPASTESSSSSVTTTSPQTQDIYVHPRPKQRHGRKSSRKEGSERRASRIEDRSRDVSKGFISRFISWSHLVGTHHSKRHQYY